MSEDSAFLDHIQRRLIEVENTPSDPIAHHNLGVAFSGAGFHRDAIAAYSKAMTLYDMPSQLVAEYQDIRRSAAEAGLQEIRAPDFVVHPARTLSALGSVYMELGRFEESKTPLRLSLELIPDDSATCCRLAVACAMTRSFVEAELMFRRAMAIEPDDVQLEENLARMLFDAEQFENSAEVYERLIAKGLRSLSAYLNLSFIKRIVNKNDEAIGLLRSARSFEPTNVELLTLLGVLLFESGYPAEAEEPLQASLSLRPGDWNTCHHLSAVFYTLGRFEESVELAEMAEKLERLAEHARK